MGGPAMAGVLRRSMSCSCVSCGIEVSGEDLIAAGPGSAEAEGLTEKQRRLQMGYCARRDCPAVYYRVRFQVCEGVDWPSIWSRTERELGTSASTATRVSGPAWWVRGWNEVRARISRRPWVALGGVAGVAVLAVVGMVRSGIAVPGLVPRGRTFMVANAGGQLHPARGRDAIPAVTDPVFAATAPNTSGLEDDDWVIGVVRGSEARAYPLWILSQREIVNDRFGSEPICVTYCPWSASAVAFVARVGRRRATFGNEGAVYECNLVMYDRATGSLWHQLGGVAIEGLHSGVRLTAVPAPVLRWGDWRRQHPATQVLVGDARQGRFYRTGPMERGQGRFQVESPSAPVSREDPRLPPMQPVAGFRYGEHAVCVPVEVLSWLEGERMELPGFPWPVEIQSERGRVKVHGAEGAPVDVPLVEAYWFTWYAAFPDSIVLPPAPRR